MQQQPPSPGTPQQPPPETPPPTQPSPAPNPPPETPPVGPDIDVPTPQPAPTPPIVLPSPPSNPTGGGVGSGAGTAVEPQAPGQPKLSMSLGYGGTLDTGIDGMNHSFVAALDRQWSLPRSVVRVIGDASQFYSPRDSTQNRFTFDVGVLGSYQWSRRAQLTINERVASGYAWQANSLTEAKSLFPEVLVRTNDLGGSLSYTISPLTQMVVAGSYNKILFDASTLRVPPTGAETLLLQNASNFASSMSLTRLVSHVDSIGISQQYWLTIQSTGEQASTYTLHSTWGRPLGVKFAIAAEGGFDGYLAEGKSGITLVPTGSVTVTRRARNGSLALQVHQGVEVLGTGTHISTSFNPNWNVVIGRNFTLALNGRVVHNTFPLDERLSYNALIGGVNASYKLALNLIASASYTYWRRQNVDAAGLLT